MSLNVFRSGQGPALLLLHGIGSSGTAWINQMSRLGDAFTCIAPDLPGYGDSPDLTRPGLDAIAAEVIALLDGESAHIVGVSFGGLTALALARQYPEQVRSLVLADATLGRATMPVHERRRWLQHRYALAGDLSVRSRERAAEIAAPGASADILDEIATHMRRARPEGYRAVAEAIAETDAMSWLHEVRQPALILCGEHDGVTGLAVSHALEKGLADARLVKVPSAGHAPHIEQPDFFAAEVRKFLAECCAKNAASSQDA